MDGSGTLSREDKLKLFTGQNTTKDCNFSNGKAIEELEGIIMTRAGKLCKNWIAYSTSNIDCTLVGHAGDVFLQEEAKNRRAINRLSPSRSASVSIRACLSRMAPIFYQKLPNEPDRRNALFVKGLCVRAASHTILPTVLAPVLPCYASVHGPVIDLLVFRKTPISSAFPGDRLSNSLLFTGKSLLLQ